LENEALGPLLTIVALTNLGDYLINVHKGSKEDF
jgi:hypothetical protein